MATEDGARPRREARATYSAPDAAAAARETGEIKAQRSAGILGLGDAGAGFAHQPAAACGGSGGAAFGLCLGGGPRGGGALILGGGLPPAVLAAVAGPAVSVPVVAGPEHPHCCAAPLEGAAFGPTPLAVAAATFADGHGAVLDSGTTFNHLPPAAVGGRRSAGGLSWRFSHPNRIRGGRGVAPPRQKSNELRRAIKKNSGTRARPQFLAPTYP